MRALLFFTLIISIDSYTQDWQSNLIHKDANGNLEYFPDNDGFIIPDFSVVGYNGNGVLDIPHNIPILKSINPISGDNTQHIQDALDSIGNLPIQANGFRGALKLNPGKYDINGTIYLNASGVVLYGSGSDSNLTSNTIIYGLGTNQRTLIELGGGYKYEWWDAQVSGTQTNIIDNVVPVGSKKFRVLSPSNFQIGDNIIIYYPFTNSLLAAMDYGGTQGASDWNLSYFSNKAIRYNTRITNISGDTIFTNSPVYYTLDKNLSQAYVYIYDRTDLITNVGIEDIRVDMNYNGPTDESHPDECIAFVEAENGWAKNCKSLHFVRSGFVTKSSNYITIDSCEALDPISQITGSRRYNFEFDRASQNILVSNCFARNARHSYISDGQSMTAGLVIHNCKATERHDVTEGHRHWTTGILWDKFVDYGNANHKHALGLHNRGNWGSTAHGWASAHAVAWNCDVSGNNPAGEIIVQKPPTAQNYVIGCKGTVINDQPFNAPRGYEEGTDTILALDPPSLYLAQLCDRLNTCDSLTTVIGQEENNKISLYPNPTKGLIYIRNKTSNKITLLNQIGQVLKVTRGQYIDISEQSPGLYFIEIDANGQIKREKVLLVD